MIMNVESEMNEEEVRIWGKMVSKTEGVKTIRGLNKIEEIWDASTSLGEMEGWEIGIKISNQNA